MNGRKVATTDKPENTASTETVEYELPDGVQVHGSAIRIDFRYRGVRCRETLKGLQVTKANIKFAENKRASILYEIGRGTFDYASHFPDSNRCREFGSNPHRDRTVDQALDLWLSVKKVRTAQSTYVNYKSKVENHIRPRWGSHRLASITKTEIEKWIALDLVVLSNKTINEVMIVLRGIFKDAKADNVRNDSPVEAIDNLPLGDREDPDPFTQTEIATILSTPTKRQQEIHMMGFAFWSGLRISELIALAWEDIDLKRGTVKVCRAKVGGRFKQTKTKRSTREVELITPALEWLQAQRPYTEDLAPRRLKVTSRDNKKTFDEEVRVVFLNSNTMKPHRSDGTVRNCFWSTHLKKAKVRYRGPNNARHTFISQLLTAGIPKEWIIRQVGHTSTRMIDEHYGRWISEDATGMAQFVSERLGVGKGLVPKRSQAGQGRDLISSKSTRYMAESEGFEPSIGVNLYTLSRGAPSATRPALREFCVARKRTWPQARHDTTAGGKSK